MNFFGLFKKKPVVNNDPIVPQNPGDDAGQKPVDNAKAEAEQPENNAEASAPSSTPIAADGKAHIYNLIIIDESGSMGYLRDATLSGVNETINTIRQAQKDFADKQTHFLTLVTFDSPGPRGVSVRTLIDAKPITEVQDFSAYSPCGCTPLYDAMGQSITRLHQLVKDDEDATAIVTVMTDGLENASHEYNARILKTLIEQLKEEGWTFNYMGSAHDVRSVCDMLSIENMLEFSHDEQGTGATWEHERSSKQRLFSRMSMDWDDMKSCSAAEKRAYRKRNSKDYYENN